MSSSAASPAVDATAALITPRGRGAVAVIRVCGVIEVVGPAIDRHFHAANGRSIAEQSLQAVRFGQWNDVESSDNQQQTEDLVVCRVSDTEIEVQCHGGDAAVNRILKHLTDAGIVTVTWQEQRATLTSPFEAECREALSRTTTVRTAGILLEQANGLLQRELEELSELARDGSSSTAARDELHSRLDALLGWSSCGRHLTTPRRVVLAGRPNVGKSTLINALLGYSRAIVYDQPGTTRDVVTGETAFDGWPVQIADTAGIRESPVDALEGEGIDRSHQAIQEADLLCLLFDVSEPETSDDRMLLREMCSKSPNDRRWIAIASKSDLPSVWTPETNVELARVSSQTGGGLEELVSRIISILVPNVPPPGAPIPVTKRQVAWIFQASACVARDDFQGASEALQNCLDGTEWQ